MVTVGPFLSQLEWKVAASGPSEAARQHRAQRLLLKSFGRKWRSVIVREELPLRIVELSSPTKEEDKKS